MKPDKAVRCYSCGACYADETGPSDEIRKLHPERANVVAHFRCPDCIAQALADEKPQRREGQ